MYDSFDRVHVVFDFCTLSYNELEASNIDK